MGIDMIEIDEFGCVDYELLLGRIVLLITQIPFHGICFDHLHVLEKKRSAVLLSIRLVIALALAKSIMCDL